MAATDLILSDRKKTVYRKRPTKFIRTVAIVHGNKMYVWDIYKARKCTTDFN